MRINRPKPKRANLESFERQTKMSWAVLLTALKDVPAEFLSFFESLSLTERPFPYALITPSYEGFMHRSQEKLICLMDDALYLADKGESFSHALCIRLNDIQHIEFATVLLDSNLQIKGFDQNGQPALISLRFNTVSDGLFKKIINTIRQASFKDSELKDGFSFEKLEAANLKLSNFARHSILAGEKVLHLIWQPELRRSRLKVHIPLLINSLLYQTVFPNHVTVLTDKELILIRETERMVHDDRYGGVWDYIPLGKIQKTTLSQDQDGLINLSIELPDNQQLNTRYLPTLRTELEDLLNSLNRN